MPTKTYEKLSENKRILLEESAIKEFSNYTYGDISINRIIRDIDMPRGSFYLYFEDKEDLYLYIMDKYVMSHIKKFPKFIVSNNGDILLSYQKILDCIVNYCENGKWASLVTKFIKGLTHRISGKVKALNSKVVVDEILASINVEYLNDDVPNNLFFVIDLLTNVLIHSLTEYLVMNIPIEKVREKYEKQLMIIRKGIYK